MGRQKTCTADKRVTEGKQCWKGMRDEVIDLIRYDSGKAAKRVEVGRFLLSRGQGEEVGMRIT